MKKNIIKNKNAFTYIELLGGLAILGTLSAIAIPNYFKSDLTIRASMVSDAKAMINLQTNFFSIDSYFMKINKRENQNNKFTIQDTLNNKLTYSISDKNNIEVKPILCNNNSKGYVLLVTNPQILNQVEYDSCENSSSEPKLASLNNNWFTAYTEYNHYVYLASLPTTPT